MFLKVSLVDKACYFKCLAQELIEHFYGVYPVESLKYQFKSDR